MTPRSGIYMHLPPASVVFVEADDHLRASYRGLSECLGVAVHAVATIDEAVALGRFIRPRVMVCEIFLDALALNGVTDRLRASSPTPMWLVGVTSDSYLDESMIRRAGFDVVLRKPFDLETLEAAIDLGVSHSHRLAPGRMH